MVRRVFFGPPRTTLGNETEAVVLVPTIEFRCSNSTANFFAAAEVAEGASGSHRVDVESVGLEVASETTRTAAAVEKVRAVVEQVCVVVVCRECLPQHGDGSLPIFSPVVHLPHGATGYENRGGAGAALASCMPAVDELELAVLEDDHL